MSAGSTAVLGTVGPDVASKAPGHTQYWVHYRYIGFLGKWVLNVYPRSLQNGPRIDGFEFRRRHFVENFEANLMAIVGRCGDAIHAPKASQRWRRAPKARVFQTLQSFLEHV